MKRLTFAIVILLGFAPSAWGHDDDKGMQAYKRGDYAEAVKWYRLAAEQGNAKAQFNLGNMYAYGDGVAQDYAQAIAWYRRAAEQDGASAQHALGLMYENGQGVAQNYAEAVKWFRLAAERGLAYGQNDLGVMYNYGRGVLQDYVQAYKWYNLAASRLPAGEVRYMAIKNRNNVASKMTPTQIAEAQRLASEWKPK